MNLKLRSVPLSVPACQLRTRDLPIAASERAAAEQPPLLVLSCVPASHFVESNVGYGFSARIGTCSRVRRRACRLASGSRVCRRLKLDGTDSAVPLGRKSQAAAAGWRRPTARRMNSSVASIASWRSGSVSG